MYSLISSHRSRTLTTGGEIDLSRQVDARRVRGAKAGRHRPHSRVHQGRLCRQALVSRQEGAQAGGRRGRRRRRSGGAAAASAHVGCHHTCGRAPTARFQDVCFTVRLGRRQYRLLVLATARGASLGGGGRLWRRRPVCAAVGGACEVAAAAGSSPIMYDSIRFSHINLHSQSKPSNRAL